MVAYSSEVVRLGIPELSGFVHSLTDELLLGRKRTIYMELQRHSALVWFGRAQHVGNHVFLRPFDGLVFTRKCSEILGLHRLSGIPFWRFRRKHLWTEIGGWAFPNIVVLLGDDF